MYSMMLINVRSTLCCTSVYVCAYMCITRSISRTQALTLTLCFRTIVDKTPLVSTSAIRTNWDLHNVGISRGGRLKEKTRLTKTSRTTMALTSGKDWWKKHCPMKGHDEGCADHNVVRSRWLGTIEYRWRWQPTNGGRSMRSQNTIMMHLAENVYFSMAKECTAFDLWESFMGRIQVHPNSSWVGNCSTWRWGR